MNEQYKNKILDTPDGCGSYLLLGEKYILDNTYCPYYPNSMLPLDWLDKSIELLQTNKPVVFSGYSGEFANFYILYAIDTAFIVCNQTDQVYERIHISEYDLCKNIYNDIKNDIDDWALWVGEALSHGNDDFDSCCQKAENIINEKLSLLKTLLDKYPLQTTDNY